MLTLYYPQISAKLSLLDEIEDLRTMNESTNVRNACGSYYRNFGDIGPLFI